MKKILYIDFPHLSIRTFLAPVPNQKWGVLDIGFHKHMIMTSLFYNINKFKPDEVVLAVDDINNWRKKVYPEYKAHRKVKREADDIDWDSYFKHVAEFVEELKTFPFKILKVPYCEADDIIGVLAATNSSTENVIITSDKDYVQLLKYKNNSLYDPIKKKFIKEKYPVRALKIKIIMGDSGDNIPAIRNRVGEKTAIKILDKGLLPEMLKEADIKKQFDINKRIISFDYIPDLLKKKILDTYHAYSFENVGGYYDWAVRHNLPNISSRIGNFQDIFEKMKNEANKSKMEELF